MILLLLTVVYLTRKGIECRARIAEIIILIAVVPIVIILLLGLSDMKISNLAPFFTASSADVITGSYMISMLFGGIELLLLVTPYLKEPNKIGKVAVQSIILVAVAHIVVTVITIGIFGAKQTSRQLWPVMTIMQIIEIPGGFIERQDALMMSFWIMTVFALINAYVFYIGVLSSKLLRTKSNHYIQLVFLPIIYTLALLPDNVPHTYEIMETANRYVGIGFLFPIPIILLIIAKIRKLGVS